jgi:mannose-6-phosphate isomerase
MNLYPLKFENIFLEKIWGGQALREKLNKPLPRNKQIGESWELSEHKSATSIVQNGSLKGKKLSDVIKQFKQDILGMHVAKTYDYLPLLFKFIDANDRLSIQVHPDDEYAGSHENDLGKTESWYVVHADPGAKIICGLKRSLEKSDIEQGIKEVNLETYLNEFEVKTGDVIYVPAGTVHAIEAGTVIYEVQEVSDITYRLYDWGRMGADGKPRALHIVQSLKVINYQDDRDHRTRPVTIEDKGFSRHILVGCRYFVIEKCDIHEKATLGLKGSFHAVTGLSGSGTLTYNVGDIELACGETLLIPDSLKQYTITQNKGDLSILLTYVPESASRMVEELHNQGIDAHRIRKLGGLE